MPSNVPSSLEQQENCKLVYTSTSTLIYFCCDLRRIICNDVAIKVLNMKDPNEEEIKRFYIEYDILTENLSNCDVSRVALKKTKHNGFHSMYLGWFNGVTLEEYITRRSKNKRSAEKYDIINAVRLSCMITNALSQIHDCKVIHNAFTTTNILVQCNDEDEGFNFSIKVIDFGSACLVTEFSDNEAEKGCPEAQNIPSNTKSSTTNEKGLHSMQHDLYSLGIILYKLFMGRNPSMEEKKAEVGHSTSKSAAETMVQNGRKKRIETQFIGNVYLALIEFGLPVSLCDLISYLLEMRETDDCYHAAADVERDLNQMLKNPERFLVDCNKDDLEGRLGIPSDWLYDRSTQISTIVNVFKKAIGSDGATEMVLISGYSGTGKSSLVQKVRKPLIASGGAFLSGKFNQTGQGVKPFHAIITAFDEYCKVIVETQSEESLDQLRSALRDCMGPHSSNELTHVIPNLSRIIGVKASSFLKLGDKQALHRFHYCFRMFVRSIASPTHPIILFLDDLHWADTASLDLIQTLVSDVENKSLFFIGCYRDSEVNHDHPLSSMICKIEKTTVRITNLKVNNIDKESVNEFISDSLCMLQHMTRPLANVVYRKTRGNPLFVIQFLKSLSEEGLLRFSLSSRRWEWNINEIESKSVANDVAELMAGRMLKLQEELQYALKLAASLGFECESSILDIWKMSKEKTNIFDCFDTVVEEGFMEKTGTKYEFVHDQIHHAAYSLIPRMGREAMHLSNGLLILNNASTFGDHIFLCTDQMNRGLRLLTHPDEKVKLSRLNLRAGKKAIATSAFLSASTYFKMGISLLSEGDWELNYELCLELFNSAAETEYVIARYDVMLKLVKEIFAHAIPFEHKIRAHYIFVKSLGSRGKLIEAINGGFQVLALLGETFPSVVNKSVLIEDLKRTRAKLDEYTEDDILSLGLMTDNIKIAAMQFLDLMILYTFMGGKEYFALVTFRMVRISLFYGILKKNSVFGFAAYGTFLCGFMGDIKTGYQFGKIAGKLSKQANDHTSIVGLHAALYGFINPWNEPIQLCLEPLLQGHRIGMLTGDLEYAFVNYVFYFHSSFQSGELLEVLSGKMKSACLQMVIYNQEMLVSSIQVFWQVVLNLMGHSNDPMQLSGDAMDKGELLKNLRQNENVQLEWLIHYNSMWLAYWFGNYDLAAVLAAQCRQDSSITSGRFFVCDFVFCDGLISLFLGRRTKKKHWRCIGLKALKTMSDWADNSQWNFSHKLELLNAELFFLDGQLKKAAKAFDNAINLAREHRFLNDQALGNERAGIFHDECGNMDAATKYYSKSQECYARWGAKAKADHVEKSIAAMHQSSSKLLSGS